MTKRRSKTSKKAAPGVPFAKGEDPRRWMNGRPKLSEQQRQFRQQLHDMSPSVVGALKDLIKKREPSVVNKVTDKLAGQDEINVRLMVEKELTAFLDMAEKVIPREHYERLLAEYSAHAD